MAARVNPGTVFSLVCDLGFAVGLVTHRAERMGYLTWIAKPVFDEEPDVATVENIDGWRWPVYFAVTTYLHRKTITKIGMIDVPPVLRKFPRMRSGNRKMGWTEVQYDENGENGVLLGTACDPSLPIAQVVNDIALKEMIQSQWTPNQVWL